MAGPQSSAGNGWGVGTALSQSAAAIGWSGYPADAVESLRTPSLDLSGSAEPLMRITHAFDIETGFDGAKIVVWDGTDWKSADVLGQGYTTQQLNYQTGFDGWWTGSQTSYQTALVDLRPWKGLPDVVVAFLFVSDVDDASMPTGWTGFWAIDRIEIGEPHQLSTQAPPPNSASTPGATSAPSPQPQPTASNQNTVFSEDFEGQGFQLGRQSLRQTPQWFVDNPASFSTPNLPAAAASGQYAAGTVFATTYDNDAQDMLYTDEIDFGAATSGTFTFKANYTLETYGSFAADGVRLLATPDRGQSWYLVTPDQGYSFQAVDAFTDASGNSSPGFSGTSGGWKTYTVDVTQHLAVSSKWSFAWEFASDLSIGDAGFFLDDISATTR